MLIASVVSLHLFALRLKLLLFHVNSMPCLRYHDNTAPFIGIHLIQGFTTSHPTPTYVRAVGTGFREGKYGNFGSGKYGHLESTMAAILLEQKHVQLS